MNQIEELEQQIESTQLSNKESDEIQHLKQESKQYMQQVSELKRELQNLHANFKMGMNENEQLRDEINLLEQRVNLETSMQD